MPSPKPEKKKDIRDVSKTLSAERRDKLIAMRDREAMKNVLCEKLTTRYGTQRDKKDDDARSVSESVIRGEVDTFVHRANLTEENLARLERRIRQHSRMKTGEAEDIQSQISAYSQYSQPSQAKRSNLTSIPEDNFSQYDWGKLDEYAKFLHENETIKYKAGLVDKQKKLRNDLDHQIADARLRRQKEQENDDAYWRDTMTQLEDWKLSEKQKEEKVREKANQAREQQNLQLLYEKQIRDTEADKKRQEEEELVRRITDEVMLEKTRNLKRKEDQRLYMQKVFEENAYEKQQKKEASEKQCEEDIEYSKKFKEMLDAQDKQKQDQLQDRLDRQKLRVEAMEKNVISVSRSKDDDAAAQAARQRKEMEERLLELERNKTDKLKKMKHDTQNFLLQQIQQHQNDKQHQRDMQRKQYQILEADTEEYNNTQKFESEKRRLRNMKHQEELSLQIHEKRGHKQQAMSVDEIAMNKHLLKKVDRALIAREVSA